MIGWATCCNHYVASQLAIVAIATKYSYTDAGILLQICTLKEGRSCVSGHCYDLAIDQYKFRFFKG